MLARDLRQRVAGLHDMQAEADIAGYDARPVDHRHDDLVDLRAVLGALLEHLDEQAVELEGGVADRGRDLELAVLAGAAADIEEAGPLVMAVMHAPVQRRLETLVDAGNEDGIADEVERFGL